MKLNKALSLKTAVTTLILTFTIVLSIILLVIVFGAEGDFDIVITGNTAGSLGTNITNELSAQSKAMGDITSITVTGNLSQSDLDWFANNKASLTKLQSIDLSDADATGLKISNSFMYNRTSLKEFKYPVGISDIGSNAFRDCRGLTGNLTIPNSVTSIGNDAFYRCSGLTGNLTIPNSVVSIGYEAFQDCSGLTGDLVIPNSVVSIGDNAFYRCSGLTGTLTIGNSVTSIERLAFGDCSGLTGGLTIPDSVSSIGEGAFQRCSGLTGSLVIPDSVTNIGGLAFTGCSGLTGSLIIPDSVTSIGEFAFSDCSRLTDITIPYNVIFPDVGYFPSYGHFTSVGADVGGVKLTFTYPSTATQAELDAVTETDMRTKMAASSNLTLNEGWVTNGTYLRKVFPLDTTPPTGSISINNGASYTKFVNVTLTLNASDTESVVTGMKFSTDGVSWSTEEAYAQGDKAYTLSVGDGTKTVYVQYKDEAGNWSISYSASIVLDTASPNLTSVTLASNNANPSYAKVGDTITVTFTADEKIYNPQVEIAGHTVTAIEGSGNTWTASYTLNNSDSEGVVTFKISNYQDTANNIGTLVATTIDNSSVTFLKALPEIDITYSTTAPTNQNVIATLNIPTGITVTNNDGSNTFTFTSNGSFTFEFKDAAGNAGTVTATVNNIDRVPPTASVEFSTTNWTTQDVTVTITPSKPVTITNNGGSNTLTFTSNGWFTFIFRDAAGNIGTITVHVNIIDRTEPTISISGNPTSWQNTDVTLSCNFTDDISGIAIKKYEVGQKDISYFNSGAIGNDLEAEDKITVTNNTWITVYTKDKAGNEKIEQVEITKIDKVAPTITLSHNPTTQTNGNVTIAATTNGTRSGIVETKWATGNQDTSYFASNGTVFTNSFLVSDNGTYTVYAQDEAGNATVATYTISNIDTNLPVLSTVTISSSNANPAYAKVGDVITLTFMADKKIYNPQVEIAGHVVTATEGSSNTWTATYTMTETDPEGVVAFKISSYKDDANNIGVVIEGTTDNSKVTFLKILPPVDAIYSTKEPTEQDVVVTLVVPAGITILNNGGSNTLTFTSNGTYTFEYSDEAGNIGTFTVEVSNIVKVPVEENNIQETEKKNETSILGVTVPQLGESIILYVGLIVGLAILIVAIILLRSKKKDAINDEE